MAPRKGRGTQLRFLALAAGVTARPATGTLIALTGMQSSEIAAGQDMADEPAGDYETTNTNMWRDGDEVQRLTWSFSIDGHVTDSAAQATALEALWDAWSTGASVWIERLRPGDTEWKGGRALVQDPTEPAAWDSELGFSCSFLGQGALTTTPTAT